MKSIRNFLAGCAAYLASIGTLAFANLFSQRTYDASLLLKAAGLVAATANGATIVDLGGTGCLDADLIIDATAIEIDTGDESYEIIVQGSPDSNFGTAANIVALASITVGHHSSARLTAEGQGFDDVPGRFLLPFRNEKNGTCYRYLRLRTVVVGTIATGINYTGWIAKDDL